MSTYYDELANSDDPARRVGWKRPIGQAYRYELVRQQLCGGESLVDVGCGEGGLAVYLSGSNCPVDYHGIESRSVDASSTVRVQIDDYRDLPPPACDCVVALGTLVGGDCTTTEKAAMKKAFELLNWMRRTTASTGILVAIDLTALEAAPWLSDPDLDGVRSQWFDDSEFTVEQVSRYELAVGWGAAINTRRAIADAFAGPFGPFNPADGAWLAAEVGDVAAARRFLSSEDVSDAALAGVVAARIDQLEALTG